MRDRDWLLLGVAGALAYLLYSKATQAVAAVIAWPAEIGNSIGGTLYEWLHPTDAGPDTYYTVLFPDGSKHAVHATDVDRYGAFNFDGSAYTLRVDNKMQRVAVLL